MKLILTYFKTSSEAWADLSLKLYEKKISTLSPFSLRELKSKSAARSSAEDKRKQDDQALLEFLAPADLVIIFDEQGKLYPSSVDFSEALVRYLESGKQRVVFCIGGPYGFGEAVRKRADAQLSLSPLTMNHFVAQTAALEQIYRALTIRKNLPYHNL